MDFLTEIRLIGSQTPSGYKYIRSLDTVRYIYDRIEHGRSFIAYKETSRVDSDGKIIYKKVNVSPYAVETYYEYDNDME
jgi:hypothetical protein